LIYTEAEREVRREFGTQMGTARKTCQKMIDIMQKYGLSKLPWHIAYQENGSGARRDKRERTIFDQ
jgi:uncharacterized protein YfbU (UPF0304 family)